MIPSALSGQLQQGLADFLRFSFWSCTPGMGHVIDDLMSEPGGLLKGPYISVKLPFVSGENPNFFPNVPLGFTPHFHQEQAFARLGGHRKLSTLVATGTGSGKTECFLLPILDYGLHDADNKGVKAILVYPMNALATDQAGRIAQMVPQQPQGPGSPGPRVVTLTSRPACTSLARAPRPVSRRRPQHHAQPQPSRPAPQDSYVARGPTGSGDQATPAR